MKAVIMAGGKGTRLRPLTQRAPKPMVPLLDRPVMEYIVELLVEHGVCEIAVTLGYLPDVIRNYFGDGRRFGCRIHYVIETEPLGTAGGVKQLQDFLDETFLVVSGDGLTDIDLSAAVASHHARKAWATVVLTEVACPLGYGVADVNDKGWIQRFIEKPTTWVEGRPYYVNTGMYVLEPQIMQWIPSDQPYDFGRELFPNLLSQGVPVHGYSAQGYWSDIGTLHQYYQSQLDMITGRVRVRLPIEEMHLGAAPHLRSEQVPV